MTYQKSMIFYDDTQKCIDFAKERAAEEGRQEGRQEGEERKSLAVARSLLKEGRAQTSRESELYFWARDALWAAPLDVRLGNPIH